MMSTRFFGMRQKYKPISKATSYFGTHSDKLKSRSLRLTVYCLPLHIALGKQDAMHQDSKSATDIWHRCQIFQTLPHCQQSIPPKEDFSLYRFTKALHSLSDLVKDGCFAISF